MYTQSTFFRNLKSFPNDRSREKRESNTVDLFDSRFIRSLKAYDMLVRGCRRGRGAEVNRIFAHGTNWTLHTAAWNTKIALAEKSRLVLMGRFAIQRSLISRRMKEVFWLNGGLCAPTSIVNVYMVLGICGWKGVLLGRAPFVFGPVNILPQLDLLKLYVSLLFHDEYAPMKFYFSLLILSNLYLVFSFFLCHKMKFSCWQFIIDSFLWHKHLKFLNLDN